MKGAHKQYDIMVIIMIVRTITSSMEYLLCARRCAKGSSEHTPQSLHVKLILRTLSQDGLLAQSQLPVCTGRSFNNGTQGQ